MGVELFSRVMRLWVVVLRIRINLMCGHFFVVMFFGRFVRVLRYFKFIRNLLLASFEVLVVVVHLYIFSFLFCLYLRLQ
jgi:F0F1-type ATP synthase membrane subunit a